MPNDPLLQTTTRETAAYAAGLRRAATQVRLYGPTHECAALELESTAETVLRDGPAGSQVEQLAEVLSHG